MSRFYALRIRPPRIFPAMKGVIMHKSTDYTLWLLQQRKNRGLRSDDADLKKGFRLSARIKELRELGYNIHTLRDEDNHGRYVLIGAPMSMMPGGQGNGERR